MQPFPEIDALEISTNRLCIRCLVEKGTATKRKSLKVYCLEDQKKYDVTICPIHHKDNHLVKLRLIEKIPREMDLKYFKSTVVFGAVYKAVLPKISNTEED